MEKILPILKFLFFNFDYFLTAAIILLWLFIKDGANLRLKDEIIKIGNLINNLFNKLAAIKTGKLLILFFIINFLIRLLMALPVPAIGAMQDIVAPHYLNLARSLYQGQGFTTEVIWNNFMQEPSIVRPDFFRVPFYPFLVFIFYKLFGYSFLSAKLVNVLVGSFLPIICYAFAFAFTKSKKIASLLLILVSFNGLLFTLVVISYPEIVYTAGFMMTLYFLHLGREKITFLNILTGVFLALTYLTRTEGLHILAPIIIFTFLYKQDKKTFLPKFALVIFGFLVVAAPYLARNYVLTKNPFYSDFDKIAMITFRNSGTIIESPSFEYNNIYEMALKEPGEITFWVFKKIIDGLILIPRALLYSYVLTILALIGICHFFKNDKNKCVFLLIIMFFHYLIIAASIGFTNRYFTPLLIIFFLFIILGVKKIYQISSPFKKSLLAIYLAIFIALNGLGGIIQGTAPYIPHSFYKRFDADKFFNDTQIFYDYIKNNTGKNDVFMVSRRPYGINYFIERPIIIFPFTDEKGVQEFMKKYNVKWLIWMGQPSKIDGKYWKFFLPDEIPENIKPVFKNTGGDLFKVEYYK